MKSIQHLHGRNSRPMFVRLPSEGLDGETAELVEPYPACLEQVLNFEFGLLPTAELWAASRFTIPRFSVVGSSAYRPFNLHLSAGVESFAIFLQPLALRQLFRLPISAFVNNNYDGYAVLGEEGHQLWERMANTPAFAERVELAEAYLLRKMLNARTNTSIMNAATYMFQARRARRLEDIASQLSLGLRQFERNFVREIGLSPKLFSRVARFQAALAPESIATIFLGLTSPPNSGTTIRPT